MRISRIDPWTIYRAQMKEIRKKYAQESLRLKQEDSVDKTKVAAQRLLDQKERITDIQVFKRGKQETMLSVFPKNGRNKEGKMHKVFNMTMEELKDYYAYRKADRFSRALESLQKRKEYKTSALLHLFHETKDFVTYDNMEEKLEIVTSLTGQDHSKYLSIDEMISSKVKKSDLHLDEKLNQRKKALEDTLNGTVANGNLGKEQILNILREYESNGVSPMVEVKEPSVPEDLESVLDKMCA